MRYLLRVIITLISTYKSTQVTGPENAVLSLAVPPHFQAQSKAMMKLRDIIYRADNSPRNHSTTCPWSLTSDSAAFARQLSHATYKDLVDAGNQEVIPVMWS